MFESDPEGRAIFISADQRRIPGRDRRGEVVTSIDPEKPLCDVKHISDMAPKWPLSRLTRPRGCDASGGGSPGSQSNGARRALPGCCRGSDCDQRSRKVAYLMLSKTAGREASPVANRQRAGCPGNDRAGFRRVVPLVRAVRNAADSGPETPPPGGAAAPVEENHQGVEERTGRSSADRDRDRDGDREAVPWQWGSGELGETGESQCLAAARWRGAPLISRPLMGAAATAAM